MPSQPPGRGETQPPIAQRRQPERHPRVAHAAQRPVNDALHAVRHLEHRSDPEQPHRDPGRLAVRGAQVQPDDRARREHVQQRRAHFEPGAEPDRHQPGRAAEDDGVGAAPAGSRAPTALPTRMLAACAIASGTMNATDRTFSATCCAAKAAGPSVPTSRPTARNNPASTAAVAATGMPRRSR